MIKLLYFLWFVCILRIIILRSWISWKIYWWAFCISIECNCYLLLLFPVPLILLPFYSLINHFSVCHSYLNMNSHVFLHFMAWIYLTTLSESLAMFSVGMAGWSHFHSKSWAEWWALISFSLESILSINNWMLSLPWMWIGSIIFSEGKIKRIEFLKAVLGTISSELACNLDGLVYIIMHHWYKLSPICRNCAPPF